MYLFLSHPTTFAQKDAFEAWMQSNLGRMSFETSFIKPKVMEVMIYSEDGNLITQDEVKFISGWFREQNLEIIVTLDSNKARIRKAQAALDMYDMTGYYFESIGEEKLGMSWSQYLSTLSGFDQALKQGTINVEDAKKWIQLQNERLGFDLYHLHELMQDSVSTFSMFSTIDRLK